MIDLDRFDRSRSVDAAFVLFSLLVVAGRTRFERVGMIVDALATKLVMPPRAG